jgi:hypothetical protein
MRTSGLILLAGLLAACTGRPRPDSPLARDAAAPATSRPQPASPPTPARLEPPDPVDTDLPGDRFAVNPMGAYRYNASREERRQARAAVTLEALRRKLATLAPEAIIGTFELAGPDELWNPVGVRYYELRDATPIIAAELRRRGEAARPALRACVGDRRLIFTGSAGPLLSLGAFCSELLEALDHGGAGR